MENPEFPNQMKLDGSHFQRIAKLEYREWGKALIRELLQNSSDAGATKIEVNWAEESRILVFKDNGIGMTRDVLQNVFLKFGGTQKAEGSVGGFGKAKEIILAAWEDWCVRSNGHLATGRHNEYRLEESEFEQGTTITLHIPASSGMHMDDFAVRSLLSKCQIKAIVLINGEPYTGSTQTKGEVACIEGFGKLYKSSLSAPLCLVRANGVLMFEEYIEGKDGFIFEISNSSSCMSANRDGFLNEYHRKFAKLFWEMTFNASGLTEYKVEIDLMVAENEEEVEETKNIFQNSKPDNGIDGVFQNFVELMNDVIKSSQVTAPLKYIPTAKMNIGNLSNEQISSEKGQEIVRALQKKAKISEFDDFARKTDFYSRFLRGRFLFRTTDLSKASQKYMLGVKAAQINFLWFGIVKEVAKVMRDKVPTARNFVVGGYVNRASEHEAVCSNGMVLLNLVKIADSRFDERLLVKLIGLSCHEVIHLGGETHGERMCSLLTEYLPLLLSEHYPKFKAIFKKVKEMKLIFKKEIQG